MPNSWNFPKRKFPISHNQHPNKQRQSENGPISNFQISNEPSKLACVLRESFPPNYSLGVNGGRVHNSIGGH